MDRIALLLGSLDRLSPIIEIGPSHSPIAPKAGGWNTNVVDTETAAVLRQRYSSLSIPIEAIEEVDTVWRDGNLHDAVPAPLHGSFRRLIASHVIEHIPDPINFFRSAERLLSMDGMIALAVPDRRYCFDFFKPASGTGDLLEAYAARRTRHSIRSVWTQSAYSAAVDGAIGWSQHPIGGAALLAGFASAAAALEKYQEGYAAPYLDCHAWHFTPAAFELAMLELSQLNLLNWRLDSLIGPFGCEFFVFLRRGAEVFDSPAELEQRRIALLYRQLEEQRELIDFAVNGGLIGRTTNLPDPIGKADAQS